MKKSLMIVSAAVVALIAGWQLQQYTRADGVTLSGQPVRWADNGGEWHIINFFAPWCSPCLREIPALNRVNKRLPAHVKITGVSFDNKNEEELRALKKQLGIEFAVMNTARETVFPMPFPEYLPATYLISPQGKVIKMLYGEQDDRSIDTLIGFTGAETSTH
ncbi:TlpA family protein disulfide reductase [Alteromonas sp. RKMC-009]|uniref:TlpA family protein disulfide reductase n=1 Tax=Alteromonas sp. RKMC-009 TaxID=2267264 RepID=UPI000E67ADFB|nr:TlpA disulfide reductase family protein [Alteromonas sp. RKMC-009]AYA64578.1 TlpA family protein disulfide reductase [Alteromonas sp. RKMC-009]